MVNVKGLRHGFNIWDAGDPNRTERLGIRQLLLTLIAVDGVTDLISLRDLINTGYGSGGDNGGQGGVLVHVLGHTDDELLIEHHAMFVKQMVLKSLAWVDVDSTTQDAGYGHSLHPHCTGSYQVLKK